MKGKVIRRGKIAALLNLGSGFDPDLTVRENTYLRGAMLGYTRKFMDEAYDQIIEFAELQDFQDHLFRQLSSGMRARLAFSLASMVQPDILILDEVLSVGDGAFRNKSASKMREIIGGGATTILVSHSLGQIQELCNKVLWIEKGRQIAFGDTNILCNLYQRFLDKTLTLDEAKDIWGSINGCHYDYLIVGSGVFGSTFAREATDRGKSCLVIDRRQHLGGNVYCETVEGITVHKYGAHIFHTDNERVWEFVNRFVKFAPYVHRVSARSGGEVYSMPFNMNTFNKLWGVTTEDEARRKLRETGAGSGVPTNLEEQAVYLVGSEIYEKLVKGYTEKQWGRPCRELPASIIKRLPLRFTYDDRYFSDKYQGVPEGGYDALIQGLLNGIPALLGISYDTLIGAFPNIADRVVYTGAIDEFFNYSLGHLEYRSLRFEEETLGRQDYQGQAVVNECDGDVPWTRTIEHKHFLRESSSKTVITREYPTEWIPGKDAYYPVNDERNNELYMRYAALAEEHPNVIFGGRLGSYKYYDMDDAIAAAMELAEKV